MDAMSAYEELLSRYGPQHWWPRHSGRRRPGFDPPFEVMVGAVLTQNTAWINVEKAVEALYRARCLDALSVKNVHPKTLRSLIRPAGYYNQKAKKLKILARAFETWQRPPTREVLLNLWGIGRETADSILLYAFEQPVFVVDAYTRRFLTFHGHETLSEADADEIREFFETSLPQDPKLFNEYHALIVRWGKEYGKPSRTSQ